MNKRTLFIISSPATLALGVALLWSCAGEGVLWTEVETPLKDGCAGCHDKDKFDTLLKNIKAIDAAFFTKANFPDKQFPSGLIKKSVDDLIKAADPAEDAKIDPKAPLRLAWILHEMHELKAVMSEKIPPDYTTEKKFNAFATLKEADSYEGCEIGDKLDKGHKDDPEGMPPLWAKKLLDKLKLNFKELKPEQLQAIKDYVDGLIPGGLKACVAGSGSAS